ncbi:hypothetical protein Ahy_B05g074689 [Arachis hypogaea]|uniref:Endonuclease/exonuclease/phosphatase domain-containing protein n=1 Tax=Arachis hypogaea TaxID=3818 RepID=A0A444YZI9_ARAHY|nr:hypothetical protein Ahy_B05g074689 [Arachis hypogaea]
MGDKRERSNEVLSEQQGKQIHKTEKGETYFVEPASDNEEKDSEANNQKSRGMARWEEQRRKTWKLLAKASDLADDPCCFIGDFNDILNQEEKTGNHPKTKNQIEKFRELVNKRELMDIDLKGSKFTWFSNPRDNIVTRERINRALVNWGWRKMFEHVTLIATPAISSDH